jgi:hypothetical protein
MDAASPARDIGCFCNYRYCSAARGAKGKYPIYMYSKLLGDILVSFPAAPHSADSGVRRPA